MPIRVFKPTLNSRGGSRPPQWVISDADKSNIMLHGIRAKIYGELHIALINYDICSSCFQN